MKLRWRDVFILGVLSIAMFCACYVFVYDQTPKVRKGRSLIGQPIARVEEEFGPPFKTVSAEVFNKTDRPLIMKGFVPRDVPIAKGRVWIYHWLNVLTAFYEEDGKVAKVYSGGT